MRSFDYCHFEITLGGVIGSSGEPISSKDVDELRKEAARLADKAVEQYKTMKRAIQKAEVAGCNRLNLRAEAERIREIAETDRTPQMTATLKAFNDACFEAERRYNYEDDWQDSDDE